MGSSTNPARNLHGFMVEIRNKSVKGTPVREVLANVFQVDPSDDFEIWRNQFLLLELLKKTENAIRALEGVDHQGYLRYFPQARKGLVSAILDQDSMGFVAFRNAFAETVLQAIDFCAFRLSEETVGVEVAQDDIDELEARLKEVFDFTTEAKLDPRVREVSLDVLAVLRTAILDYHIRGTEGLEESIERSLGRLIIFWQRAEGKAQPANHEQVGKLLDLIIKFESIVAKARSYGPVLGELGAKLLGA